MRNATNNPDRLPAASLPDGLGATPIAGHGLTAGTLAGELGERPTLLVFLRHYG